MGAAGNDRRQKRHGTHFSHIGKRLCSNQAAKTLSDNDHFGAAGKTLQTIERHARVGNPVRCTACIIRVEGVTRAQIVESQAGDTASGQPLGQYPLKLAAAQLLHAPWADEKNGMALSDILARRMENPGEPIKRDRMRNRPIRGNAGKRQCIKRRIAACTL
jgi:hypothetical protein